MTTWRRKELLGGRLFLCAGNGCYGARAGRYYLSLRTPGFPQPWQELRSIRCRTLASHQGWRLVWTVRP